MSEPLAWPSACLLCKGKALGVQLHLGRCSRLRVIRPVRSAGCGSPELLAAAGNQAHASSGSGPVSRQWHAAHFVPRDSAQFYRTCSGLLCWSCCDSPELRVAAGCPTQTCPRSEPTQQLQPRPAPCVSEWLHPAAAVTAAGSVHTAVVITQLSRDLQLRLLQRLLPVLQQGDATSSPLPGQARGAGRNLRCNTLPELPASAREYSSSRLPAPRLLQLLSLHERAGLADGPGLAGSATAQAANAPAPARVTSYRLLHPQAVRCAHVFAGCELCAGRRRLRFQDRCFQVQGAVRSSPILRLPGSLQTAFCKPEAWLAVDSQ